jgi:hypothetical protein
MGWSLVLLYREVTYIHNLICSNRCTIFVSNSFENRVLRRIFGPKREEVAGGWRKLHKKEHHNLYAPQDIFRVIKRRRIRWAGLVTRMREIKKAYKVLVGKTKRKSPLGRPSRRWEDRSYRNRVRSRGLDSSGSG